MQLQADMAAQHNAREMRELAQYADHEAQEDCWDAKQTFKGRFSTPKLKEVLCILNLQSTDDLLEILCNLGKNKKKSNDTWVLQTAIKIQLMHDCICICCQ